VTAVVLSCLTARGRQSTSEKKTRPLKVDSVKWVIPQFIRGRKNRRCRPIVSQCSFLTTRNCYQFLRCWSHTFPNYVLNLFSASFQCGSASSSRSPPLSTRRCLGTLPATWLTSAAASLTLAQEDCARQRLVRFLSVGWGPTLAPERSV